MSAIIQACPERATRVEGITGSCSRCRAWEHSETAGLFASVTYGRHGSCRHGDVHVRTVSLTLTLFIATGVLVRGAIAPVPGGSLGGRQVFPRSNWWNLDISRAPADPASASYINFISGRTASNPTATRRVHPDFGPSPYGIPYVVVSGDQPLVRPTWTAYGDESDEGAAGRPPGYPIPDEARSQPDYIEGGLPGGGLDGDRHLLIVDRDNWLLYETGATYWNAAANRWEANCGAIFDMTRNDRRPETWTSADAAGLAILPGLARYDEVASGRIDHALRARLKPSKLASTNACDISRARSERKFMKTTASPSTTFAPSRTTVGFTNSSFSPRAYARSSASTALAACSGESAFATASYASCTRSQRLSRSIAK